MSLIVQPEASPAAIEQPAAVVASETPLVVVAPVVEAPVRPDGVPDAYWDTTTGLKSAEAIARLTELETADASRREGVPADASGYKLELAEPILGSDGKTPIGFNAEDPLAKGALAWAHENGVSQAGLSKLLGVFAANEMAGLKAVSESVAAETAKLGANSDARFTAVNSALTAHAGADGAKAIMAGVGTAAAVEALERVLKAITGPSVGSPPVAVKTTSHAELHGADLLSALRAA